MAKKFLLNIILPDRLRIPFMGLNTVTFIFTQLFILKIMCTCLLKFIKL